MLRIAGNKRRKFEQSNRWLIDVLGEEKKLLKKLHTDLIPRLNVDGVRAETIAVLQELSQKGSWVTVPYLLSIVIGHQEDIADAAASGIANLMQGILPSELARLDERVRGPFWYTTEYRKLWDQSTLEAVSLLRGMSPPVVFMGLCSMHRNGRVREIAIQELDQISDGSELPYLLLRTTDWVQIVSNKAKNAIRARRLTSAYAKHYLANMALIDQLRQRHRGDTAGLFQSIQELCLKADTSEFLNALKNKDFKTRRLCFYIGLGAQRASQSHIIKAGLSNKDNIVRKIALLAALAQAKGEELWALIERALKDPFPSHRREAIGLLLTHFPEKANEQLPHFLLDRAPKVRGMAKYHMKERDASFDFAQFYREKLKSEDPKTVVSALGGLAECKQQDDYAIVELFLSNQNRQVKKAAMGAMTYLNKERTVPHLLEFMSSTDKGIASAAQRNLQKCLRFVTAEELWRIYSGNKDPRIQINILRSLSKLSPWDSLGYLLLGLKNKDASVKQVAIDSLKWWQNKNRYSWGQILPSKIQRERVRLAAPLVASEITGPKFRELHLAIDSVL